MSTCRAHMCAPSPCSPSSHWAHGQAEPRREALVDAIQANERRYHALAFRMLGDRHAAEDAVQEASLRALKAIAGFRGDASMATWLHRIVVNVCIEERRRRCPVVLDSADDVGHLAVARDFADALATRTDVAEALATLPTAQREAFVLVHVRGMDYTEAGAFLGVPGGTVGSRVHRAKQSIRGLLAPRVPGGSRGPVLDQGHNDSSSVRDRSANRAASVGGTAGGGSTCIASFHPFP